MSRVTTFFRHCPSCGRRFEIRLVAKQEIEDETETARVKEFQPALSGRKESTLMLESERPATIEVAEVEEVKTYTYNYQCRHCGHEWSERQYKRSEERASPEYRGD